VVLRQRGGEDKGLLLELVADDYVNKPFIRRMLGALAPFHAPAALRVSGFFPWSRLRMSVHEVLEVWRGSRGFHQHEAFAGLKIGHF